MLTSRFDEALAFASDLHRIQVRKGSGVPYVAHLLAVSAIALENGATEDEAIAALLHDAIEDQGGAPTAAKILAKFGEKVHEIVVGCTDTDVTPKPPWRARKEAYIAHVKNATASVKLVSASDKLHNARSIAADHRAVGAGIWNRFTGGREGSLWYYRALVDAYREGSPNKALTQLIGELDRAVTELEGLA